MSKFKNDQNFKETKIDVIKDSDSKKSGSNALGFLYNTVLLRGILFLGLMSRYASAQTEGRPERPTGVPTENPFSSASPTTNFPSISPVSNQPSLRSVSPSSLPSNQPSSKPSISCNTTLEEFLDNCEEGSLELDGKVGVARCEGGQFDLEQVELEEYCGDAFNVTEFLNGGQVACVDDVPSNSVEEIRNVSHVCDNEEIKRSSNNGGLADWAVGTIVGVSMAASAACLALCCSTNNKKTLVKG